MFSTLMSLIMIFTAYKMGVIRATNSDITKQTDYMQGLIDKAYYSRDLMKKELKEANIKAESWERRYWNLWESITEEDEEDE